MLKNYLVWTEVKMVYKKEDIDGHTEGDLSLHN